MIYLDIETFPIENYAPLLPVPVGCAILEEGREPVYYSWGHKTTNNCTKEEFRAVLLSHWDSEMATHNGLNFDIPILTHHFNLPQRDPLLTHDTLFLAYLLNPHARSLSLKDLVKDWLGIQPTEQKEMQDWIMANTECRSRKEAGAYIWEVPGDMAGRYASADVSMTHALYNHCAPKVLPNMQEPYDRERKLAPILADLQNRGVLCDLERLEKDTVVAVQKLHELDTAVREHLSAPELDLGKKAQLVEVMQECGYTGFLTTPTGKLSAAADSLDAALEEDPYLRDLLKQRATYATLTSTFMLPWLEAARANGGRIHASYNQVRNPDGFGTRTGRLSSSRPNFQNVPSGRLGAGYPVMRSYLLPEPDAVWVCGDFSNQEPRITAHFEDGRLAEEYKANPKLDPYMFVAELCGIERHPAKQVLLGIIYAMGAAAMAAQIGCEDAEASRLRTIIRATLPDIAQLDADCKKRFNMGLPIRTLGGRYYYCEPPSNGRTWAYKALNTLIQGSAADQTKEALIYTAGKLLPDERILGTVHDEWSISCRPERVGDVMAIMREAANALPCDIPMLLDINVGETWADAK